MIIVDRTNVQQAFPLVERYIRSATFVSLSVACSLSSLHKKVEKSSRTEATAGGQVHRKRSSLQRQTSTKRKNGQVADDDASKQERIVDAIAESAPTGDDGAVPAPVAQGNSDAAAKSVGLDAGMESNFQSNDSGFDDLALSDSSESAHSDDSDPDVVLHSSFRTGSAGAGKGESFGQQGPNASAAASRQRFLKCMRILRTNGDAIFEVSLSTFRRMRPKDEGSCTNPEHIAAMASINNTSVHCDSCGFRKSRRQTSSPYGVRYAMKTFTFLFSPKHAAVSVACIQALAKKGVALNESISRGISYKIKKPPEQYLPPAGGMEKVSLAGVSRSANAALPGQETVRTSNTAPNFSAFPKSSDASLWSWGRGLLVSIPMAEGRGADLLNLISSSCVPIVVYDGFEELVALYHAFHAPLCDLETGDAAVNSLEHLTELLGKLLPRVMDARYIAESHFMEQTSSLDDLFNSHTRLKLQNQDTSVRRGKMAGGGSMHGGKLASRILEGQGFSAGSRSNNSSVHRGQILRFLQQQSQNVSLNPSNLAGDHPENRSLADLFRGEFPDDDVFKVAQIEGLLEDSFDSPVTSVRHGTYFVPERGFLHYKDESIRGQRNAQPLLGRVSDAESMQRASQARAAAADGSIHGQTFALKATKSRDSVHGATAFGDGTNHGRLEDTVVADDTTALRSLDSLWEPDLGNAEELEAGEMRVFYESGTAMLSLAEKRGSQHGGEIFRKFFKSQRAMEHLHNTDTIHRSMSVDSEVNKALQGDTVTAGNRDSADPSSSSLKPTSGSIKREGVEMSKDIDLGRGTAKEAQQIGTIFATFGERVGWQNANSLFEGQLFAGRGSDPISIHGPALRAQQPSADRSSAVAPDKSSSSLFQSSQQYLFGSPESNGSTAEGSEGSSTNAMGSQGDSSMGSAASATGTVDPSSFSGAFGDRVSSSNIRMGYLTRLGLHQPFVSRPGSSGFSVSSGNRFVVNSFGSSAPPKVSEMLKPSPVASTLVDRILDILMPNQFSEVLRSAIFEHIAMVIKCSLNGQSFCFGNFAYKTYLADSTLDIGAFLVAHEDDMSGGNWCIRLMSMLCENSVTGFVKLSSAATSRITENMSASSGAAGNASSMAGGNGTAGSASATDAESIQALRVYNMTFRRLEASLSPCITFMCPGDIRVRISLNQVSCMNYAFFLDELDRLIGKDNLLKRSICLVYAWCLYGVRITEENFFNDSAVIHSSAFSEYQSVGIGTMYQNGLPIRAIEILVLYIFNAFNSSLETPLDVLFKFLSFYSRLDWLSYGICLHGVVRLKDGSVIPPSRPDDLLVRDSFLRMFSRNSNHSDVQMNSGGGDARDSTNSVGIGSDPSQMNASLDPADGSTSRFSYPSFQSIIPGSINIFDPLDGKINLCSHLNKESITAIAKGFQKGVKDADIFANNPTNATLQQMMGIASQRHLQLWKTEAPNLGMLLDRALNAPVDSSAGLITPEFAVLRPSEYLLSAGALEYFPKQNPFEADSTALRNNLEYVRFIVDSQVTELGLLAFLTQILAENGCLLIGEIGQHLRSTFGRQDWGAVLKERFGGLKRFLLKHSDLFYVDSDHPLNPHIYLRSYRNGPVLLLNNASAVNSDVEGGVGGGVGGGGTTGSGAGHGGLGQDASSAVLGSDKSSAERKRDKKRNKTKDKSSGGGGGGGASASSGGNVYNPNASMNTGMVGMNQPQANSAMMASMVNGTGNPGGLNTNRMHGGMATMMNDPNIMITGGVSAKGQLGGNAMVGGYDKSAYYQNVAASNMMGNGMNPSSSHYMSPSGADRPHAGSRGYPSSGHHSAAPHRQNMNTNPPDSMQGSNMRHHGVFGSNIPQGVAMGPNLHPTGATNMPNNMPSASPTMHPGAYYPNIQQSLGQPYHAAGHTHRVGNSVPPGMRVSHSDFDIASALTSSYSGNRMSGRAYTAAMHNHHGYRASQNHIPEDMRDFVQDDFAGIPSGKVKDITDHLGLSFLDDN